MGNKSSIEEAEVEGAMHHGLRNVKNAIIHRLGLGRGRHFSSLSRELSLPWNPTPCFISHFFATSLTLPTAHSCKRQRGHIIRGQLTGVGLGELKVEGFPELTLIRLKSHSVNELPGGIND